MSEERSKTGNKCIIMDVYYGNNMQNSTHEGDRGWQRYCEGEWGDSANQTLWPPNKAITELH